MWLSWKDVWPSRFKKIMFPAAVLLAMLLLYSGVNGDQLLTPDATRTISNSVTTTTEQTVTTDGNNIRLTTPGNLEITPQQGTYIAGPLNLSDGLVVLGGSIALPPGSIQTSQLADEAITGSKIALGSLNLSNFTTAALQSINQLIHSALNTTTSLLQQTILTNETALLNQVNTELAGVTSTVSSTVPTTINQVLSLADGSVTLTKLAPEVVDQLGTVPDGTITGVKVALGTLTGSNILAGSLTNTDIADTAGITLSKLVSGGANQLLVTNSSGSPVYTTLTGDASLVGGALTIGNGVIDTTKLANGAVSSLNLSPGAVTTTALADGAVNGAKVLAGSIGTANIADSAISSAKIASGAVSTAQLGLGSVTSAILGNQAVTTTNLANGAVSTAALQDGSVTGLKILDGSIGDSDVSSLAGIGLSKLAAGAAGQLPIANSSGVLTYQTIAGDLGVQSNGVMTIADSAVSSAKIASGAITATQLGAGAVGTTALSDQAVNSAKLATGAVSTTTLQDGAVTGLKILDGAIGDSDISSTAAIALSKLTAGTAGQLITANNSGIPTYTTLTGDAGLSGSGLLTLGNGVITTPKLATGAVMTTNLADGAVSGLKILDGTITDSDIGSGAAIALSKLTTGTAGQLVMGNASGIPTYTTLTGDAGLSSGGLLTIGAGAVTASKILDGTITATKIANSTLTATQLSPSAGIALTQLASGTAGQLILANGSGVPTYTALSGDLSLTSSGVVTIANGAITSAKILDNSITGSDILAGTITDSNISSAAAIAGSKILPDFGGQNITTNGSLTIGGGTPIKKYISTTVTVATNAISAITCGILGTVTVTGAAVGDTVFATPLSTASGIETVNLTWSSFVSAANTISIRACNPTLGLLNILDTQSWQIDVWSH